MRNVFHLVKKTVGCCKVLILLFCAGRHSQHSVKESQVLDDWYFGRSWIMSVPYLCPLFKGQCCIMFIWINCDLTTDLNKIFASLRIAGFIRY